MSLRAYAVIAAASSFCFAPSNAYAAESCDDVLGSARGLCVAYCEAQECHLGAGNGRSCERLAANYARITGGGELPCEQEPACEPAETMIFYGASESGGGLFRANGDGGDAGFILEPDGTFYQGVGVDSLAERVYYSTWGLGIESANFDGSDRAHVSDDVAESIDVDAEAGVVAYATWNSVSVMPVGGGGGTTVVGGDWSAEIMDVSVDPQEQMIYFSWMDYNSYGCKVDRVGYDGSARTTVWSGDDYGFCHGSPLAVDPVHRQLYFEDWHQADGSWQPLRRMDLDTGAVSTFTIDSYSGRSIQVDPYEGFLYFRSSPNNLSRVRLDGTGEEELLDWPAAHGSISRNAGLFLGGAQCAAQ